MDVKRNKMVKWLMKLDMLYTLFDDRPRTGAEGASYLQ